METGKTGKYLKYALGEILLVMIGILLALQVNNWNETQRKNSFERKVLNEILMDTEQDINEMNNALTQLRESQASSNFIIDYCTQNNTYNDSMDIHFANSLRMWALSPNTTAFEAAKTEGLHLIKNDSIRTMVAKINDYYFDYVKVLESRWQDYNTNIVLTYTLSLFDYYNFSRMKPLNYASLREDFTYLGIIRTLSAMRKRYIDWLEERYNVLRDLNRMIKEELE